MAVSALKADGALSQSHPWNLAQLFGLTPKEGKASFWLNQEGPSKPKFPDNPWIRLTWDWRSAQSKAYLTAEHQEFHLLSPTAHRTLRLINSVTRGCFPLIPNYSRTSSLSELDKSQSFHSLTPHLCSALYGVTSPQTQVHVVFSSQYFRGKKYFLFYLKWRLAVVILDLLVGSPE